MQNAVSNSKSSVHACLLIAKLQQTIVRDDDQSYRFPTRSSIPSCAFFIPGFLQKEKGLVTIAIVRAPHWFGNSANNRCRTLCRFRRP